MESRFWKDLPLVRDKDGVRGTKIYSQPEGEIVHMYLEAGAKLPLHTTPVNVAFYILEGNPTIIIGDEEQSFAPDTIIDSPKNVPHGIINNSDKPARLLVIKMPKP